MTPLSDYLIEKIRRMAVAGEDSPTIARRLMMHTRHVEPFMEDAAARSKVFAWVNTAQAGDTWVYHCGDLANDRRHNKALDTMASTLLDAELKGLVVLYQKRVGTSLWGYTARRKRQLDLKKLLSSERRGQKSCDVMG